MDLGELSCGVSLAFGAGGGRGWGCACWVPLYLFLLGLFEVFGLMGLMVCRGFGIGGWLIFFCKSEFSLGAWVSKGAKGR